MELACENKTSQIKPYEQVKKDYESLKKIGFKLEYANKNLKLPFSKEDIPEDVIQENLNKIKGNLNDIMQTSDFVAGKTGYSAKIMDEEDIDLEAVFKLKLFCYTQTGYRLKKEGDSYSKTRIPTGFQSLRIYFRLKETNFSYNQESFTALMEVMERRAEIYAGLAENYENDFAKTRTDSEKSFQQKLVSKMSEYDGRKEMAQIANSPFTENDIPFEMEFTFYASNKKLENENEQAIKEAIDEENNQDEVEIENERNRGNKKGRIDNIFIDFKNKKVKFVELKIDDGVIGGSNGIHKHLLDMANGLEKNKNFKNEFAKIVKTRYEILKHFGINEEYGIDISELSKELDNDFALSYDIICGYSKDEDIVRNRFDSIKPLNILDEEVFNVVSETNKKTSKYYYNKFKEYLLGTEEENSTNKYIKELLTYNISNYENYLQEKHQCPVNIYITDQEYSKYDVLK